MNTTELSHSEQQAISQLENICEMVKHIGGDDRERSDSATELVQESPLDVTVRSDWYNLRNGPDKPFEFCILLCTGGPAVRIIGELDARLQPWNPRIEHQDWGKPWTPLNHIFVNEDKEAALLTYCQQFFFGE